MHLPQPIPSRPTNSVVFPDAETLWNHFQRYKLHCTTNQVEVGNRGRLVARPMTIFGFANFVGCGDSTVRRAADRDDLRDTWQVIEADIVDNLVVGGLLRNLDSNLVARVAELVERSVVESTVNNPENKYDFDKLTPEELDTLTELLAKAEKDT